MKPIAKKTAHALASLLSLPLAAISLLGRIHPLYLIGAHTVALAPGLIGDYLRGAFYRWTLQSCAVNSRISFGVILSSPDTEIATGVYIGPYCVLGRTRLGRNVQIASLVQILSGAKQHPRRPDGSLMGAGQGEFQKIEIGAECWIGAAAIIMADVGPCSTVGAGAVVTRKVESGVVVVGNPARILKRIEPAGQSI